MTIEISGAMLRSFLYAGESLQLLVQADVQKIMAYDPAAWYPIEELRTIVASASRYKNHGSILVQIGIEMVKTWYRQGPGQEVISSSVDFLHLQTGSRGYRSVVKGEPEQIGSFDLLELNEPGGTATVRSSTLFPAELERGILLGGLGLAGDLLYYTVQSNPEVGRFDIHFVTKQNRATLSWHHGESLEEGEWRFKQLRNETAEKERFWDSINRTLNEAYREMQEALSRVKTLSGMLPICASCKKIRDDKGYWQQIEAYLTEHSEAEFSHGLCPECLRRLYPG